MNRHVRAGVMPTIAGPRKKRAEAICNERKLIQLAPFYEDMRNLFRQA